MKNLQANKVTNLENFALEQIVRPYQSLKWGEKRLFYLPCELITLVQMLEEKSEWSEKVLNRIFRCKFWFPEYINHPLKRVIEKYNAIQTHKFMEGN